MSQLAEFEFGRDVGGKRGETERKEDERRGPRGEAGRERTSWGTLRGEGSSAGGGANLRG